MRLALYTFGIFRERADDPVNDGFRARNELNFAAAERSAGFIARSGYEDGPPSWGAARYPRFYVERGDEWSPQALSLWDSIEAALAFSYHGIHAEALAHAREWFDKPSWPPYVAWWVGPDHIPQWSEAAERLEHLHDHGPTPRAFSFKRAFDPEGNAYRTDGARLRTLIAANEATTEKAGLTLPAA